jgi:hypothetical protein
VGKKKVAGSLIVVSEMRVKKGHVVNAEPIKIPIANWSQQNKNYIE